MTTRLQNITQCLDKIITIANGKLMVGTPLGIGKPNPLINALWQHVKQNPSLNLEIFTALSLQVPKGKSLLERNFLKPFTDKLFPNHPNLDYIDDVKRNKVPAHMKVTEFYMQSGKMLGSATAQRNYTSSNYTHAARDMLDKGLNVVLQMVAVKETENGRVYSLSSNTDLTLDIVNICQQRQVAKPFMVAMVNPHMPFMGGKAQVSEDFFDIILDDESLYFAPFATPRAAVNTVDYSIGLLASTLVADGGTMQVGIGSLGDALVYSIQLKHQHNQDYLDLLNSLHIVENHQEIIAKVGDLGVFNEGIYAASEMFVEGFAHLFDAGILKRKVYEDAQIQNLINKKIITQNIPSNIIEILIKQHVLDEVITQKQLQRLQNLGILQNDLLMHKGYMQNAQGKKFKTDLQNDKNIQNIQKHCLGEKLSNGVVLHGGFFLGSRWFYQWLHQLSSENRKLFQMVGVSQVNELYGGEALDRVQRVKARFINTCMKVDLLGAAASDTLDDNQVVSGVGGQYNFVAMAHALTDSRSILMLRSTHKTQHGRVSNIVWKYPYCTIPRHLRDIVITEYGMADLRGQSDEECIKRMICIADAQFQQELRQKAIDCHKLDDKWQIPQQFCNNTSAQLKVKFAELKDKGYFPQFPFGSDFSEEELHIIKALTYLKNNTGSTFAKIKLLGKAFFTKIDTQKQQNYFIRMNLQQPQSKEEKLAQKLFNFALKKIK